ncbi:type I restriction enzyme HsdR N-terminal domain-containing protein [Salidesulfovibrio onnuriiensis]|uniref:type I restriction enzyme HsdR N-terminal domain-containing protein n=1 Tax=Salidesulfovibrio onnuriiensis TaxID=2583823 RepID=UPI0011C702A0|nr:type I restriction enzyme HsdR N-terminal domain-containing protein [Salidesulfovibrio onnuriiensis]
MHETSLGGTLRDYLTGEEVEDTTFEEFRQALARLLVEEKGYPKERIHPKVMLTYAVEGQEFERALDFVVYGPDDKPMLLILFCIGSVSSYVRETLCAAKLLDGGPVPLALTTDTNDAVLLEVKSGESLRQGMAAVLEWSELLTLAEQTAVPELTLEQRDKLTRIFHAYSGFLFSCCNGACPAAGPKKE